MAQRPLTLSRETAALRVDRDAVLLACFQAMFTERCRAALYTTGRLPADDELRLLALQVVDTYPCRNPGQVAAKLLAGE